MPTSEPRRPRHDKDEIKSRISMAEVATHYGVELRAAGHELNALCPFHTENSPSFTITPEKNEFYCFGCGAGGDQIEFVMRHDNLSFDKALDKLADLCGAAPVDVPRTSKKRTAETVYSVPPAGTEPPKELRVNGGGGWQSLPVIGAWPYHNTDGEVVAYTCRVEPEPGKKDVIPVRWGARNGKPATWVQKSLDEPRLLYGAHLLAQRPGEMVVLVEGEKTADAARRLLPSRLVTTWPGGGKAVGKADWSQLRGRKVIAWPDNDQAGIDAMLAVAERVDGVKIIQPPDAAKGWDLADAEAEGWDTARVVQYIKDHPLTEQQPEPEYLPADIPPPPPPQDDTERQPFRVLGWDRGEAYYLPRDSRQVVALAAGSHTRLNLLQIAPLWYWMQNFEAQAKRSGPDTVDWTYAADAMMRSAKAAGIFDRDLIRGLGAWWDDGRCVVHLGSSVIMDGRAYEVDSVPSRYTYEMARSTRIGTGSPMTQAEAHRFVQICESLRWESPVYGKLCAGWVFLAPICGALDWRPHIWVTGEPGSGKTTIINMIKRALGSNMRMFLGDTTEAGVRQRLGCDALPVLFDEFESERKKSASRVEDVMSLITQASSETGGELAKGGVGGRAASFKIRSMFCFSSVAVAIKQVAARTRITVLSVRTAEEPTPEGIQQYNDLLTNIRETLTDDYIDRLQARAVSLIPIIRQNAVIFAEAAALVLKQRRFGDQIGTLLAGAYALHSGGLISPENATKWIQAQDWREQTSEQDSSDKSDCLSFIMSHVVRVQDSKDRQQDRTIGELVAQVANQDRRGDIYIEDAVEALGRNGVRIQDGMICIASPHKYIERILIETPWEVSYSRTLLRLDGAQRSEHHLTFAGVRKRAICVPVSHVL